MKPHASLRVSRQMITKSIGSCSSAVRAVGLIVLAVYGIVTDAAAVTQSTSRVSVDSLGLEVNGDSFGGGAGGLSFDGRYVVFTSGADNLVPMDSNGAIDVFRKDLGTGQVIRASVDSVGTEGNAGSYGACISGDGRFVAFVSAASNLVPVDANGFTDIFLFDCWSGITTRVSESALGVESNGPSYSPSLSLDGAYIAFHSSATNLGITDTNSKSDIYMRNLLTGIVSRVSEDPLGAQANGDSLNPRLSWDGGIVVFESNANNLVWGDLNQRSDIFIKDRSTGATARASISTQGVEGDYTSRMASISADGRWICYQSFATNLVPMDYNYDYDVFLHDRLLRTTTRVSVSTNGVEGNLGSYGSRVSQNGRYVVFDSLATNLAPGDTNGFMDVFLRDCLLGETTLVSMSSTLLIGNGESYTPMGVTHDGAQIVYTSQADNLVPGDNNQAADVFAYDRGSATSFAVSAQMNLYGAGHLTAPDPGGGGGGILPLQIAIPPGVTTIRFVGVSGTCLWEGSNPAISSSPDGRRIRPWDLDVTSHDGISGIKSDHQGFLAGVFVGAAEPQNPSPARLEVQDADREAMVISPLLHQSFFIGDGLGGAGNDQTQSFVIPVGATRVFLGYHDSFYWVGLPGHYQDNSGEFLVNDIVFAMDADHDGLEDAEEQLAGTDPYDQDTDDDGLSDGEEVLYTVTNPLLTDTDGDLVQDGTEFGRAWGWPGDALNGILGTDLNVFVEDADPLTSTDPKDLDSDDDGLDDGVEDLDANGAQSFGETDAARFDSDGDTLGDGLERGMSVPGPDTNPNVFIPDSDPLTTTNPLEADTDAGGNDDGSEDWNGNGAYEPLEGDPNIAADDHFVLVVGNLVAGQVVTISVNGGRSQQRVIVALSRSGTGPIYPPQGFELMLTPPITELPSFVISSNGVGSVTLRVPSAIPPGTIAYWQAVEITSGGASYRTSNALTTQTQ